MSMEAEPTWHQIPCEVEGGVSTVEEPDDRVACQPRYTTRTSRSMLISDDHLVVLLEEIAQRLKAIHPPRTSDLDPPGSSGS